MKAWPLWLSHSEAIRTRNSVPKGTRPWTTRRGISLVGVPATLRAHDVLDTVWSVAVKQAARSTPASDIRKSLFCDLSQDIKRQPLTAAKRSRGLPSMVTGTVYYSFEEDTTISGRGNLQLLGHPPGRMSRQSFSESQLRDLAGEGFSVPHACLISFLLFSNPFGAWWDSSSVQ